MHWLFRLFERKQPEEKIIKVQVYCKDTEAVCAYEWEGRLFKTPELRDQAKRNKELGRIRTEFEDHIRRIFNCHHGDDKIRLNSLTIVLLDRPTEFRKFMDAYQNLKEEV